MTPGRLEAFSDGVIAILITIMVLDLKVPHGGELAALRPQLPVFLCYALSFAYVGIYWNNHHHLFKACGRVSGGALWANLHLLFWLSLVPFATAWMGENGFAPAPTALYGAILLLSAVAFAILARVLVTIEGPDSVLAEAVGRDRKGWVSMAGYAAAIPLSFVAPKAACGLYVAVAVLWFVPDRRVERTLARRGTGDPSA